MTRGMKVRALVYPSGEAILRVWEDVGEGVLLTTEGEYEAALEEDREPIVVGFPRTDVRPFEDHSPTEE